MIEVNSKQLKIAQRYALALSSFEDSYQVLNELVELSQALNESKDLYAFLTNPVVTNNDKKDVLSKVCGDFSLHTINFLNVLIDKNRFSYFQSILTELDAIIDEKNNIKRVEVVSAVDLSDYEKSRLVDKLQSKLCSSVKVNYVIDENILAGLIIKIGDKVIDNSLKSRFASLKRQLI